MWRLDAYPYKWVASLKNVKAYLYLKKNLHSSLKDGKRSKNDGNITEEQDLHLQNVWKISNFNTFEDFLKFEHFTLKKMYYY